MPDWGGISQKPATEFFTLACQLVPVWNTGELMSIDSNSNIHDRLAAAEAALRAVGQQLSPAIRHVEIAVLIPAYNEATTIGDVVKSFRAALPNSRVYVYDNNSWDNTAANARQAGAIVRREPMQGKGHVVRRMFSDIEADVYVMVDGDATYDAASAPRLVSRLIETQADMVVGARITEEKAAYRANGRIGSRVLTRVVSKIFGDRFTDMQSGYRAFSRRFVKSFPALASGFETEIDLTVHALELGMITTEIQTPYVARAIEPLSKLAIIRDGLRSSATMCRLLCNERPLMFFGAISGATLLTALGAPAMAMISGVALVTGIALQTVNLGRRETKRLSYNSFESLAAKLDRLEETRLTLSSLRTQTLQDNPAVPTNYIARRRSTH